jgi:hypothetical protein
LNFSHDSSRLKGDTRVRIVWRTIKQYWIAFPTTQPAPFGGR